MRRFDFDTVLVALNAADVHRLSFIQTVLPEAVRRGMGVIGMKVYSERAMLGSAKLSPEEAMSYVLSLEGVSTVVIGCGDPAEVAENARIAREFQPLGAEVRRSLEQRTVRFAPAATYYKRPD